MQRRPRAAALDLGRDGRALLAALVGPDVGGWKIEHARLRGAALELVLVGDGARATLEVSSPRRDRPVPTRTRSLAVHALGGREGPSPHGAALAEALFRRLASQSFPDLFERLRRDALYYSDPSGSDVPSRLDRHHRRSDHGPDWWKFFYPSSRHLEQEVRLQGRVVRVSHGTAECRFNNPQLPVGSLRYFADERRGRAPDESVYVDTSLTEADVLAGRTMERLSDALGRATGERPSVVHLMTTCLPELIGDDPRPLLRKLARDPDVAVCWTSKTRDASFAFDALVERAIADVRFAEQRDPRTVVLAGVPSERAGREARAWLEAVGLHVATELFPALGRHDVEAAARAGAVVWLDPVGWEKIGNEPFLRQGLAVVRFHPPYGAAGTRAWLERVCTVLGIDASAVAALDARHAADLGPIRARCRGHRVALVGDAADLDVLVSHGRALGRSVAGLLCELGFEVVCLAYAPPGTDLRPEAPVAAGAGTLEVVPFATPEQLDARLGERIDAAFTHFGHDPRLARWGIAPFCEDVFELGYEGLARSARRLLHLAETRPFPAHRAELAEAALDAG